MTLGSRWRKGAGAHHAARGASAGAGRAPRLLYLLIKPCGGRGRRGGGAARACAPLDLLQEPACRGLLTLFSLQVLREAEGALELVDVSASLPALQRVPGLRTWGVQAKEGFFGAWDVAQAVRARLLLVPIAFALHMQTRYFLRSHAGQRHATDAQHVSAGRRAAAGAVPAHVAAPRRHRRLLHCCDAQDARAARPRARPVRPATTACCWCSSTALRTQHLVQKLYYCITCIGVASRRAEPVAEKGSEPAFSVPAARQAPLPAEALAAAAGLAPAMEASEQSPGPVPAAADAGTAVGAAADPPPAAGQGGADPVGDAAYEEVVGLAEDAADAAKVFAQAIRQQVRSPWHLLQGLARVFSCEPCDPAALILSAGHSSGH